VPETVSAKLRKEGLALGVVAHMIDGERKCLLELVVNLRVEGAADARSLD
jgi:hypothetical protein